MQRIFLYFIQTLSILLRGLLMNSDNLFWFDNVEFRTHPWPGLNWVTTMLQVPNVKKARDLYVAAFNFVPIFELPNSSDMSQFDMVRLRYRGANFVIVTEGNDYEGQAPVTSKAAPPFVFYVYVDDAETSYQQAVKSGMTSLIETGETFWGDMRARVRCPFGYIWDIAHRISKHS